MSVLVKDLTEKKLYVFIKGAPERLYESSTNKPENFIKTLESLSMSGYRTIAVGYKVIDEAELEEYMKA